VAELQKHLAWVKLQPPRSASGAIIGLWKHDLSLRALDRAVPLGPATRERPRNGEHDCWREAHILRYGTVTPAQMDELRKTPGRTSQTLRLYPPKDGARLALRILSVGLFIKQLMDFAETGESEPITNILAAWTKCAKTL
jgi:hypothetical protein